MTVIKIENLWKEYRLGVIGHGTLTHDLQSWWARVRGKEDPNSKIAPMLAGQERQIDGDHFWALRDINIEVKEGDILGIIGKNGAGKSTLLKILSRVTAPTRGNIKVKGRIASLLEVGTGFHPELTGRENIFMNGAILGMSKQEIRSKLDEVIDFSGVEDFVDTPVKRYSSGMYVRLAFAVAAHLEPEILVVDEVLAVGDVEFQKKCLGKMKSISGEGRTILFVSHQMNAIENLCSSGIVLGQGNVSFKSDSIRDVVNDYLSCGEENIQLSSQWNCDDNQIQNPYFELMRFYLTDESGSLLELPTKNNKDMFVNIEFNINNLDPALTFGYDLFDDNNQHVYACGQTDGQESDWPELELGYNHIRMKIPCYFLNEGDYYLQMNASLYKRMWLVNPSKEQVKIDLSIRGGLSESPYWMTKRGGVMAPVFLWKVIR